MNDDHQTLMLLIQEMLDGELDDDQRADLLRRVEEDDAVQMLYLDQIATATGLQAVLADRTPPKVNGAAESIEKHQSPSATTSGRRSMLAFASLAVAVLLLVSTVAYFSWQKLKNNQTAEAIHVAVVTQSVGAYDGDGVAIRSGQQVLSGQLHLDRGLIRLDFTSGARVAVEGPAEIDVVDDMRVILVRGVATATIPESAIGFVVDTETAHVVDLGTAFGVSVGDDGTTDVCVFAGEVSVARKGSIEKQPSLVREGHAVRATEQSPTIDPADYEVAPFEGAWPVNSGVLQTTGSIRFVSPGPDFHPANCEDNEHIVVYPERSSVILKETIRVDLVDPDQYAKSRYREKETLPSGRRVTSYLFQFNAFSTEQFDNRKRSVRGQITFEKPIVGVITSGRLLQESEVIFGNPDFDYPVPRSVEPRPEGDDRPGFDSVTLAADQRTLILELQVAPNKLDQLRVLVEADNRPTTDK